MLLRHGLADGGDRLAGHYLSNERHEIRQRGIDRLAMTEAGVKMSLHNRALGAGIAHQRKLGGRRHVMILPTGSDEQGLRQVHG